jgi:hypothetical protein
VGLAHVGRKRVRERKIMNFVDLLVMTDWYPDPAPFWPQVATGILDCHGQPKMTSQWTEEMMFAIKAGHYHWSEEEEAEYWKHHHPVYK